jgi:hypothetical protein
MRKIVLSALLAAGLGLAGIAGAAAAPASATLGAAAPAASLVKQAQVVIIGPRRPRYHRPRRYRYCYNVRRCYRTGYGRLVCRVRRVCTWRYR